MYGDAVRGVEFIAPQRVLEGSCNSYWCYAVRYLHRDVSWQRFRQKYIEFGGDGIYAAWALSYDETYMASGAWRGLCPPLYDKLEYPRGLCPTAERIQPTLMQFVNNYGSTSEAEPKVDALYKTVRHFS
jgi:perosamine synthetase